MQEMKYIVKIPFSLHCKVLYVTIYKARQIACLKWNLWDLYKFMLEMLMISS